MIDASSFAAHHNAFWSNFTPTSEYFVRRINLEHAERWSLPIHKPEDPIRSALVAELAFAQVSAKLDGIPEERVGEVALEEAKKRLRPLFEDPISLVQEITQVEQDQISSLEKNLLSFFTRRNLPTVTRPLFAGCGYVDSSEGDIISGSCLFEIKAVNRPFRSIDIRQLITYCALNHLSGQFQLDAIGVFNPRRGLYFEASIEDVSHEISGQSGQELFDTIIHAISSGDISR
ncbi:hypothetical protein [Pannonibacter phragmitetus]|uniref:hypothetical protein n=1 Tax=Pannonibacter phragmitetus TaxID=121719 RepID=UPI000B1BFEAF|nr:hypothetical protein [Pannonibacter phragmitetus]